MGVWKSGQLRQGVRGVLRTLPALYAWQVGYATGYLLAELLALATRWVGVRYCHDAAKPGSSLQSASGPSMRMELSWKGGGVAHVL